MRMEKSQKKPTSTKNRVIKRPVATSTPNKIPNPNASRHLARIDRSGNKSTSRERTPDNPNASRHLARIDRSGGKSSERKRKIPTEKCDVTKKRKSQIKAATHSLPRTVAKSRRKVSTKPRGYTVDEEDPDYHVYSVNGQRCKRWKTTAKSTQDYIEEIMNSAKSVVLSETSAVSYVEVNETLDNLKMGILSKLRKTTAPTLKAENYRSLNQVAKLLEDRLTASQQQNKKLEEEIEKQDKLINETEAKIENYRRHVEDSKAVNRQLVERELHPLLQNSYTPVLDLPSALARITRRKTESIASTSGVEVLQRLTEMSNNDQMDTIQQFIGTLEDVDSSQS